MYNSTLLGDSIFSNHYSSQAAMISEQYDTDISLDLLADLPNWDESELIEYINRIAQELRNTRSQQIQLGKHVEQLSGTVDKLVRRVGKLSHRHDQLDAKVRSLVQDVDETKELSRQAENTANSASSEVKQLRDETFQLVDDRLASLSRRVEEFVGSV